jgi:hypothetical protein
MAVFLQTVQRIVVIIAGGFAIFLMYQYHIETERREKESLYTDILLIKECSELDRRLSGPVGVTTRQLDVRVKCKQLGLLYDHI